MVETIMQLNAKYELNIPDLSYCSALTFEITAQKAGFDDSPPITIAVTRYRKGPRWGPFSFCTYGRIVITQAFRRVSSRKEQKDYERPRHHKHDKKEHYEIIHIIWHEIRDNADRDMKNNCEDLKTLATNKSI